MLAAENRILKAHLPSRLRLSDPERSTLAEIGKRLGRKRLKDVACTAKPDIILAWYRRLIARKIDGSKHRIYPGRPRVETAIEELVVRFAREAQPVAQPRVRQIRNLCHRHRTGADRVPIYGDVGSVCKGLRTVACKRAARIHFSTAVIAYRKRNLSIHAGSKVAQRLAGRSKPKTTGFYDPVQ
jgi:hypothetical protein